jgi:type II secretory pathway component PulJ
MPKLMRSTPRVCTSGFSLVELMVALVVGLVVVGAVLALVVAIMKSNRETLQATRLNQELRATLAVIANDLRRARSVDDPLKEAMTPGGNPYAAVSTATNECVVYAYAGALNGPWHLIKRASGAIVLQGMSTRPANCSHSGTPVRLGSEQVEITGLQFSPTTTTGTATATDEGVVRKLTVTFTGHLVDPNTGLAGISRSVSQTVFVRSVGAGI